MVHPLTRAEFALMEHLTAARGCIVDRNELFQHINDQAGVSNIDTLSTLIYRLRRKLPTQEGEDMIITLPRVGYRVNMRIEPLATRAQHRGGQGAM